MTPRPAGPTIAPGGRVAVAAWVGGAGAALAGGGVAAPGWFAAPGFAAGVACPEPGLAPGAGAGAGGGAAAVGPPANMEVVSLIARKSTPLARLVLSSW